MKKVVKIGIILLSFVVLGLGINYVFYEPTTFNAIMDAKIYSEPANSYFDDENFYNCVVDAYNKENNTSVAYSDSLTDEQLQTITNLNCYGYNKLDEEKIVSTKGLEKMSNLNVLILTDNLIDNINLTENRQLTRLYLSGNKLKSLDISQNTTITILDIGYWSYSSETQRQGNRKGNLISLLDVSNNLSLKELYVNSNQLKKLDISQNILLQTLDVSFNQLTELDVSSNTNLKTLEVNSNHLTNIDVSNNKLLVELAVGDSYDGNQLTKLDISNNPQLTTLYASRNQLTELDVSKNGNLKYLSVSSNKLSKLDISSNLLLKTLDVGVNQLTELDVSQNVQLTQLTLIYNQLTELDLSNNSALTTLYAYNNKLKGLDLSNNLSLKTLMIGNNSYSENQYIYKGKTINIGNNIKIPVHLGWTNPTLISSDANIANVGTNGLITSLMSGTVQVVGTLSGKYSNTTTLNIVEITTDKYSINEKEEYILINGDGTKQEIESNINVSHDGVTIEVDLENDVLYVKYKEEILKQFNIKHKYFEDNQFYNCVIDNYNEQNGTTIGYETYLNAKELLTIKELRCGSKGITNTKGLEKMTELVVLNLSNNLTTNSDSLKNQIKTIDLTNNTKLMHLYISRNQLTSLDLSNNTQLEVLSASSNQLLEIDLKNNTKLQNVYLDNNQLVNLDGSNNPKLTQLLIHNNKLTNINLKHNIELTYLDVTSNELSELDLNNNYNLHTIYISNNKLTSLDLSNNTQLYSLSISNNPYNQKIYVYKNESIIIENNVKIPDHLEWSEPIWTNNNTDIITVDERGLIRGLKTGIATITGEVEGKYSTTVNVDVVEITTNEYKLGSNYIYIGTNNEIQNSNMNVSENNIIVNTNKDNNKLQVIHNNKILKEFQIFSINLGKLKEIDGKIAVPQSFLYNEFMSVLNINKDLTYKIFNGPTEIISGNITKGMSLKVYYNDEEIDSFDITQEYLEFAESIKVDEVNSYLSNININTQVNNILDKINTSGEVTIVNKNGAIITDDDKIGTGSKIVVKLTSKTYEYEVIINGDIDGDGSLKLSDIMKMANYIYKDKNSLTGVYLKAIDYDNNGIYNLQDIMKGAKALYGGN